MKTILRFSVLLVLAVATQAMAALESAKIYADEAMPRFPNSLVSEGVIEGHVVLAISISATGRVTDSLVLEYTHEPLVRACLSVLNNWKITPARFDGENVPVQSELRIDFKREGVVETSSMNITNHFLFGRLAGMVGKKLAYRLPVQRELDRMPVPVTTVEPQFAQEAEKQGVRGSVQVRFYIDEQGAVRLPSVGSGSDAYLSNAAVSALRQWRFEPAMREGRPVMVAASQQFNFGGAR